MAKIRFGVIGVGGMGRTHIGYMKGMSTARLTAVCDIIESRAAGAAEEFGVKAFLDHRDLIDSGLVDAVIVATPHYPHAEICIAAMKRGLHVICEKPLGVSLSPVDKLIRTAKRTGVVFSVMYQWRTIPRFRKAKELIEAGKLGDLQRVQWIVPDYRSQAYYDGDSWRATWATEGGGVLVNQAPHYTDMLWYLTGRPKTIMAKTRTKLRRIEVEDEGEALLDYPNGATGYYYTCTTEYPGRRLLRIAGNEAVLDIEDDALRLGRYKTSLTRFDKINKAPFARPGVDWREVRVATRKEAGHRAITMNFIRAINNPRTKLIAPGVEGIHQVEITCGMILSSMTGKPVTLPVSRPAYDKLLAKLQRTSIAKDGKKPAAKKEAVTVFS